MEYEFTLGKRIDSKLLYVLTEKQLYKKAREAKEHIVYRCYESTCKARVKIMRSGVCTKVDSFKEHDHDIQESRYKQFKIEGEIKQQCAVSSSLVNTSSTVGNVREIYHATCQKLVIPVHEYTSTCIFGLLRGNNNKMWYITFLFSVDEQTRKNLNYKSMERNLLKIRSKVFPQNPQTYEAVKNAMQSENILKTFGYTKGPSPKLFFKGIFKASDENSENNECYCIFASDDIMQLIHENIDVHRRQYFTDATFKVCPLGLFNQLLMIYVGYMETVSSPFIFNIVYTNTRVRVN